MIIDYENPWQFDEIDVTSDQIEKWQGFVYLIENRETGRKYIGKKNFWTPKTSYKTDPKTKKKKKIRSRIESDWKAYYGSSKSLEADVLALGKENFKRSILHFCDNKSQMSYLELREQIDARVLENDLYYNDWIMVRVRKAHLKLNTL